MHPVLARLLAAAFLLASVACGDVAVPATRVVGLPDSVELHPGDSMRLLAYVTSATGGLAWTSSDPAVATVDAAGGVEARSVGRAVIRATLATDARVADSAIVVVTAPAPCTGCTGPIVSLSIQSIADTLGRAAELQAIHGTIVVTAWADVPGAIDSVDVEFRVDTLRLCVVPLASARSATACRANVDSTTGGIRRIPAGPHVLTVVLRRQRTGTVLASTSMAILVVDLAPATAVRSPLALASTWDPVENACGGPRRLTFSRSFGREMIDA